MLGNLAHTVLQVGQHIFILQEKNILFIKMGEPTKKVLKVISECQLTVQKEIKEGVKVPTGPIVNLEVSVVVVVAENFYFLLALFFK